MSNYKNRRITMVDTQVRPSDVTKFPIIDAMLAVPREEYVPQSRRSVAYADCDVVLSEQRVLLAARSFAKLLDASGVGPQDVVLDLGCGLGYSSAVLSRIAKAVVAIEPDATFAAEAQGALSRQGADNAAVICGAPADGNAKSAPYDAIFVNGAVEQWPDALTEQLKDGGVALAIWADERLGTARLGLRREGRMIWRDLFNVNAPVMAGFGRKRAFQL